MSKILRATGALFIVAGILMDRHAYYNIFKDGRVKMLLKTIGNGLGSRYAICGMDDSNLEDFTSVDFAEKSASDLKYYFYNIENPKEYLNGDDAIAVEKGPYMMKKHSIKYNVGFKTSSLTDSGEPDPNGAIEYDVANAYVVLDKNTDVTTTLSRDTGDLALSWSSDQRKTLSSYEKAMPDHLKMGDTVTNLSPIYLSALGQSNDEFSLVLSMSCTSAQIANIPFASASTSPKMQCSASQMNDMDETDCACCMLGDEYLANSSPTDYTNCDSFFDEAGPVMSTLSLLAYYDNGIAVKESGEAKYDKSGDIFTETHFKQQSFYSGLIQSHSVNDIMFGYPSAFIGNVVPNLNMALVHEVMEEAGTANPTRKEVATEILTGKMDDKIPFKLGNLAEYTKKVGAVCLATCESVGPSDALADSPLGWMCNGNAPDRHKTNNMDEIFLGEIDCKPYSSTFATKMMCNQIETILTADPTAAGYDACMCADGSEDWKDSGCCLASGQYDGLDLTASGCLYPVAGAVDPNYVGMDEASSNGKPKVDIGQAMEAWVSRESTSKQSQFMCPDQGVFIAEHKAFGQYESFSGSSSHVTFHSTGNPRIRQGDAVDATSVAHTTTVSGGSTKHFPPTGLTAYFSDTAISNGHTFKRDIPVFLQEIKRPVMFEEDWGLTAKICGTDLCLELARLFTSSETFIGDNTTLAAGTGWPYDGLQAIGHMDGPSDNGRPTYVNQPLFLNGDKELLSQQNSSHVDGKTGNGIKMYRPKSSSSDPGTFIVGDANANYDLVDDSWLEANKETLQSYMDMEAATGLGIRSKIRFGLSYSVWECDPKSNDNCALSRYSDGAGDCYGTEGSNLFNAMETSKKDDLTAVNKNDFTYACSAANVLTPKVVGGKIMPMYWYEDSRQEVNTADVDGVSGLAKEWFNLSNSFGWVWFVGWLLWLHLGFAMLFRWFYFAPTKEFLVQGPVGQNSASATATSSSSATSVAAAAVSSASAVAN